VVLWQCGPRQPVLTGAYTTATAIMDSTWSWFVCYKHGAYHSGGNDVWYYTLGDRTEIGMEERRKWGYMPAVHVWTSIDPWPGMPQCPGVSAIPRGNHVANPVYFVHGFEASAQSDCHAWANAMNQYGSSIRGASAMTGSLITVGYYKDDLNCDLPLTSGTVNTRIKDLGALLASKIYNTYSKFGVSVDLVGHSMGGLIVRAAIYGTRQQAAGYPPYLYVEDAVTLSTPHNGITSLAFAECAEFFALQNKPVPIQCGEIAGGSALLSWLNADRNPQSNQGTDWTVLGSDDDTTVNAASATNMDACHKVIYNQGHGVDHSHIRTLATGTGFPLRYWNCFSPTWTPITWISPVEWAHDANYYWYSY
jgi:pimeloyl-ACP methyl ester carboxylesterase